MHIVCGHESVTCACGLPAVGVDNDDDYAVFHGVIVPIFCDVADEPVDGSDVCGGDIGAARARQARIDEASAECARTPCSCGATRQIASPTRFGRQAAHAVVIRCPVAHALSGAAASSETGPLWKHRPHRVELAKPCAIGAEASTPVLP